MYKRVSKSAVLAAILTSSGATHAIEFDGFLTAGLALQDQADVTYLDGATDNVSFDNDSKFGLQVTTNLNSEMKVVAQILAAGADDNYDMDVEWAYLDYIIGESFSLRGGKIKQPVFLISDYFEVGYAYPWIRPPQEVYRTNPINSIVGMEALYQLNFDDLSLTLQPYLGSNSEAVPGTGGAVTFNAEKFIGMAFMVNTRNFTFQASYMQTDVETLSQVPALADFVAQGKADLSSIGLSWDFNNFVGYTEYVKRNLTDSEFDNSMENIFPDQTGFYLTLGYRIDKYLVHATTASSESNPATTTSGGDINQSSMTLGLRYELNYSASLKVELQQIDASNQTISPFGRGGLFAGSPDSDKVNMLSIAVDVIF